MNCPTALGQNIGGLIMQSRASGYWNFNWTLVFVVNQGGFAGKAGFCSFICNKPFALFLEWCTLYFATLFFFSHNKAVSEIKEHIFLLKVCCSTPADLLLLMRATVVPSAPLHSNGQAAFFIMRDTNVNKAFSLSVAAIILSLSSFSSSCRQFCNSWCAEKWLAFHYYDRCPVPICLPSHILLKGHPWEPLIRWMLSNSFVQTKRFEKVNHLAAAQRLGIALCLRELKGLERPNAYHTPKDL